MIRMFLASSRPGIYFKVLRKGQIQVGDNLKIIKKEKNNVTVKDIVKLYVTRDRADNIETMRRAIKIMALSEGWKSEFQKILNDWSIRLR
jgi:MOSC domain-containing protein YiiM